MARPLFVLSETRFQRQVEAYASLAGWKLWHDAATNQPRACGACTSRLRAMGQPSAAIWPQTRYACPTCHRAAPNVRNEKGFLDLTLLRPPRVVYAELKAEDGHVTPEQADRIALLRACPGVEVYVWRPSDFPEIERVLGRHEWR